MKVSHLLVVGLIGFIVFRLTQSVQPPPPAPEGEEEPRSRVETLPTSSSTMTSAPAPGNGEGSRAETESMLRTLLQKMSAALPPAKKGEQAPPSDTGQPGLATVPGPAAAPAPEAPFDLETAAPSDRQRMRAAQERRLVMLKEHGEPQWYKGIVRRHLGAEKVHIGSSEVGECIVEEYMTAARANDGAIVVFEGWSIGTQPYVNQDGEKRTALHVVYAAPKLPLWDKFGRPINRDVLPPEAIRQAGLHTETLLDHKRPTK